MIVSVIYAVFTVSLQFTDKKKKKGVVQEEVVKEALSLPVIENQKCVIQNNTAHVKTSALHSKCTALKCTALKYAIQGHSLRERISEKLH